MIDLANTLGWRVTARPDLPSGLDATSVRETRTIAVRPSGFRSRDEFSLAHELFELYLPGAAELPHDPKEELCDRGGSALLLPAAPFRATVAEVGPDVLALKHRWRFASYTAISKRLVALGLASTAVCWLGLDEHWRVGEAVQPAAEVVARALAHRRGRAHVGRVRAWRFGGSGLGYVVGVG